MFGFHLHHHHHLDEATACVLTGIYTMLQRLERTMETDMTVLKDKLDAVLANVRAERSQIAGFSTLIQGLRETVAQTLANGGVDQTVIDEVQEIFAQTEENKAAAADAMNAGTAVTGDPSANGEGATATQPSQS